MVANKHTRKEVGIFCDKVIHLLSELKIDEKDKSKIKEYNDIQKRSEKCKNLINTAKKKIPDDESKYKKNSYNNYVQDCFKIINNEKGSNILNKDIEKYIKENAIENNNYFKLFGEIWSNRLDEVTKEKYKPINSNEHDENKDKKKSRIRAKKHTD